MRPTILALLLVFAGVWAAGSAPARTAPPLDAVTTVVRMDTNHDGTVSRQEWVASGGAGALRPAP